MLKSAFIAILAIGLPTAVSAQQGNRNQTPQPKQQPASSASLSCNKTTKNYNDCLACGQRHGWTTAQAGSHCRKVFNN